MTSTRAGGALPSRPGSSIPSLASGCSLAGCSYFLSLPQYSFSFSPSLSRCCFFPPMVACPPSLFLILSFCCTVCLIFFILPALSCITIFFLFCPFVLLFVFSFVLPPILFFFLFVLLPVPLILPVFFCSYLPPVSVLFLLQLFLFSLTLCCSLTLFSSLHPCPAAQCCFFLLHLSLLLPILSFSPLHLCLAQFYFYLSSTLS